MHKKDFHIVIVTTLVMIISSNTRAAEDKKNAMEGTWNLIAGEYNGDALPPKLIKQWSAVVVVKGAIWTETTGDKIGKRESGDSSIKINADPSPKEIDLTEIVKKGEQAKTTLGIYEINGDTLKVCIGRDGKRPTQMKSTDKSTMVRIFSRAKA